MTETRIEDLLRECAPQVLAVLVRRHGDFAAAEDAVQEALLAAALQWPADGTPNNPRGWLIQVASRRLTDEIRSVSAQRRREQSLVVDADTEADEALVADTDDTLKLLVLCCHSSLTKASAIALTLRAVGGLTTAEIANALLVPEATMAQRISRAKQKIKSSGSTFALPSPDERAARLAAVLHVLYLMFNEGYAASSGEALQRRDLAAEAIRLTRLLREAAPDEPEVLGLLALMLLTDARRMARSGPAGELVPLDEQNRALWDHVEITEGLALVPAALAFGRVGPYQVQAAIAALHDEASSTDTTDWPQIRALYRVLRQMSDNPMIALNEAIAAAMVEGPAAGLTMLARLETDERLAGHYRLDAVRGHLLERLGDNAGAQAAFRSAAGRTASVPERNYLLAKAARQ